jgi:hypothetical protein
MPWTVYFYYDTRTEAGGSLEVYELFEGQGITEARLKDEVIPRLTRNARGSKDDPRPIGSNVGDVAWKRKSYLVFALDTGDEYDPQDPLRIKPGHGFRDGGMGTIPVDQGSPIQVVWTVNYQKDKDGKDLKEGQGGDYVLSFRRRGDPAPASKADKGVDRNFGRGPGHGGGHGHGRPPWADDNGKNTGGSPPP